MLQSTRRAALAFSSAAIFLVAFGSATGQSFTFQGKLTNDSDVPLNGVFDLRFSLHDALVSGNPVGPTLTINDTTLSDGFVNTALNFGDVFAGTDLWLEIGVRPGPSGGAFEAIGPRTPILWSPRATTAARVGSLMALGDDPYPGIDFRSPNDMRFHLDDDDDDVNEWFSVLNGADEVILQLTEGGILLALNGTGDSAIQLPVASISAVETWDEPGLVSTVSGFNTLPNLTPVNVGSATITVPAAGYVIAFAIFQAGFDGDGLIHFGISKVSATLPSPYAGVSGHDLDTPNVSFHDVFEVSAGSHTFYLVAQESQGSNSLGDVRLSLIYLPTNYGTVTASSQPELPTALAAPTTDPLDVETERAASIQVNQQRIERELADIGAKLEALKTEVRKGQR